MENLVMINLVEAIKILKVRFSEDLRCIETGTIRSYTEKHNSTLHISEALGNRGSLISVDISPKSIEISMDICRKMNVKWICSDSLEYLKKQDAKFHFAFLDSMNSRDHIFEEFKLLVPQMIPGGIIIVDDAGVTFDGKEKSNTPQEKGRKISKFLLALEHTNFVRNSSHGAQLWIDMKNSVGKIIREALK